MERYFIGLAPKNVLVTVKEEGPDDGYYNSVQVRNSAMQWSFSNKVSAMPQYLSFKAGQEDKPKKTGFESLPSAEYITVSTVETFDSNWKPNSGIVQKNMNHEMPVRTHYAVTTYRPQEFKILPVANKTNQTLSAISTPVRQSFIASAGENMITSGANSRPLGGASPVAPVSIVPARSPLVGSTDLRDTPKNPPEPAQLTIFYAGSVCVYDDVSPEKAQAIMLLAGNESYVTPNPRLSAAPALTVMPRPVIDGFFLSQSQSLAPCSGLSSSISVTSHSGSQSAGGSRGINEIINVKPAEIFPSSYNKLESSKVQTSLGTAPATSISSAVPQVPKASLARFLEKRKERVMSASPYARKPSPDCNTPESSNGSFNVTL